MVSFFYTWEIRLSTIGLRLAMPSIFVAFILGCLSWLSSLVACQAFTLIKIVNGPYQLVWLFICVSTDTVKVLQTSFFVWFLVVVTKKGPW